MATSLQSDRLPNGHVPLISQGSSSSSSNYIPSSSETIANLRKTHGIDGITSKRVRQRHHPTSSQLEADLQAVKRERKRREYRRKLGIDNGSTLTNKVLPFSNSI